MITIQSGSNAEVFKRVLTFYVKPPAKVLDITCGYKKFWDKIAYNCMGGYRVWFMDIRPLGDVMGDYHRLPFRENWFDAVIFDPPYMHKWGWDVDRFRDKDRYRPNVYMIDRSWRDAYALGEKAFTAEEYEQVGAQAFGVLKSKGWFIHKIQDGVKTGWMHFEAYNRLSKLFDLYDLIIYDIRSGHHILEKVGPEEGSGEWKKRRAIKTHAYFMVFRRKY
jgi:hypothetical protein